MLRRTLALALVLLPAALWASTPASVIRQIQQKYAPDRRTARVEVACHEFATAAVLTGETTSAQARDEIVAGVSGLLPGRQLIDEIEVLPAAELEGRTYGVVTIAVATVRAEADYSSEAQTQLLMGMPVRILKDEGWYFIQTPEGYLGWVAKRGVKAMDREEFNRYVAADKAVFLPMNGTIYSAPDLRSQPLSDVTAGALLRTGTRKGKFMQVSTADGRTGYVPREQIEAFERWKKRRPDAQGVIATAYDLLGTSYLWSGTSPKMLDCSGMTKTVYLLHGLVLARDASQQCLTGQEVDVSGGWQALEPGDLVFFGAKRITHVGIYIGEGKFIHEAGLVHVSSFNPAHEEYSEHWLGRLKRAARIISTEDSGRGVWSVERHPLYNPQQ